MIAPYTIGIDPGLSGAIALFDRSRGYVTEIWDIPTVVVNKKNRVDLPRLREIMLSQVPSSATACLEYVSAMPGQGVSSTFRFGETFGMLQAFLSARAVMWGTVTPAQWKAALNVPKGANKDYMRLLAGRLMPASASMWPLVKHDGRAEAAMLAMYGNTLVSRDTK